MSEEKMVNGEAEEHIANGLKKVGVSKVFEEHIDGCSKRSSSMEEESHPIPITITAKSSRTIRGDVELVCRYEKQLSSTREEVDWDKETVSSYSIEHKSSILLPLTKEEGGFLNGVLSMLKDKKL